VGWIQQVRETKEGAGSEKLGSSQVDLVSDKREVESFLNPVDVLTWTLNTVMNMLIWLRFFDMF